MRIFVSKNNVDYSKENQRYVIKLKEVRPFTSSSGRGESYSSGFPYIEIKRWAGKKKTLTKRAPQYGKDSRIDYFEITGSNRLCGEVNVQSAKNAVLPILTASLLTTEEVSINNIPDILDVKNMLTILSQLGVRYRYEGKTLCLNSNQIEPLKMDFRLCKTMRSSMSLLGSMLFRFKNIMLTTPGGCRLGDRPIDIHVKAFKKMGVKVKNLGDYIFFDARSAHSARIKLKIPSVGATENILQFASLLAGKTTIINPAREPEIVDLANFLNKMGANIQGAGSGKITIYGVDRLRGVAYTPIGDRIVAGSLMVAAAITGGDLTLHNANPQHNENLINILTRMGCQIDLKCDTIHISTGIRLKNVNDLATGFYPNFPTDLQSIMLPLLCVAEGKSLVKENIFKSRFQIVGELQKMGADMTQIDDHTVSIKGGSKLASANVSACELRGGMGLILAALAANGKTRISNIHYIDRGYEHIEAVLASLGASIERRCAHLTTNKRHQ